MYESRGINIEKYTKILLLHERTSICSVGLVTTLGTRRI